MNKPSNIPKKPFYKQHPVKTIIAIAVLILGLMSFFGGNYVLNANKSNRDMQKELKASKKTRDSLLEIFENASKNIEKDEGKKQEAHKKFTDLNTKLKEDEKQLDIFTINTRFHNDSLLSRYNFKARN